MTPATRLLAPLAAALALGAALLATAGPAASHDPVARAASSNCAKRGTHGFSYLYYIHVAGGTSCSTGRTVTGGYRGCLNHHHTSCTTHSYRCNRRVLASSPTELDARVLCKRGRRKAVGFRYTQFK
jgi:uncharacterized membrane protein